jgi:thiol-disulfide isomerase/thioredoxin
MKFLKYILLLLVGQLSVAQEVINEKQFNASINKAGVFVVEFWANWNASNECKFLKDLEQCNKARVCIASSKALADDYNINVLPTLVVFNNSEEICRFKGNLLFKLDVNKKQVQGIIDSIFISKFE